MTIERLQQLLEQGVITQDEFDSMSKILAPTETPEETPAEEPESKPESIDYDKLEKILQSRLDKAMAQERKKTADVQKQLERLQREKMTDEELKNVEIEEKERDIAERERALAEKENKLYAIKAIKEAGLDDGTDTSLALVDFVMGADETEIDERVRNFKKLFTDAVNKAVTAEVNKRFKDAGRTPQQGTTLNGGKNPWMKNQWNITEQMNIEFSDADLAAQLKAAAGVK